jgi:hypothetical protein
VPCCEQTVVAVGQKPRVLRLEFVAGDDLPLTFTFLRDLDGYDLEADVVDAGGDPLQAFAITTQNVTINGSTATRAFLSLTRVQTAAIASHEGARWSLRWTAPGDKVRTIFLGRVLSVRR